VTKWCISSKEKAAALGLLLHIITQFSGWAAENQKVPKSLQLASADVRHHKVYNQQHECRTLTRDVWRQCAFSLKSIALSTWRAPNYYLRNFFFSSICFCRLFASVSLIMADYILLHFYIPSEPCKAQEQPWVTPDLSLKEFAFRPENICVCCIYSLQKTVIFPLNKVNDWQLMSLVLLFHYLLLNMFRVLVHPSSGDCELFVEWSTASACIRIPLHPSRTTP